MIKTEKFELTSKAYMSIVLRVLLKKKWWLFILMWLCSLVIFLSDERDALMTFLMYFAIFYPVLVIITYWRFTTSKQNKLLFTEREHEIYNEKIVSNLQNGSTSTIFIDSFVKTFEIKDAYLLYISKNQSMIFPKRHFKSKEDENWFRKEIFLRIKHSR